MNKLEVQHSEEEQKSIKEAQETTNETSPKRLRGYIRNAFENLRVEEDATEEHIHQRDSVPNMFFGRGSTKTGSPDSVERRDGILSSLHIIITN